MSPVDDIQRHCSSCEKVITDFSNMSDDELMLYFRHSKGKTCGRFSNNQLNRRMKLLPQKTEKAYWWKTLLLIPLSLLSKNSKAQTDTLKPADSVQAITTRIDSITSDELAAKIDSVLPDSTTIASQKPDTAQPATKIEVELRNDPWIVEPDPQIYVLGCICTGPIPEAESTPVWVKFIDSLFPAGSKKPGDQLENPNGLKQLADQPEQKPKPQEPALPASNDLNAILPEELRKPKRA